MLDTSTFIAKEHRDIVTLVVDVLIAPCTEYIATSMISSRLLEYKAWKDRRESDYSELNW